MKLVVNMSLSRLSEKCQKCPFVDKCDNKRMGALAYLPDSAINIGKKIASANAAAPMAREIVERYMYGEKYVMYKDELEKELYGALYKNLGLKYCD